MLSEKTTVIFVIDIENSLPEYNWLENERNKALGIQYNGIGAGGVFDDIILNIKKIYRNELPIEISNTDKIINKTKFITLIKEYTYVLWKYLPKELIEIVPISFKEKVFKKTIINKAFFLVTFKGKKWCKDEYIDRVKFEEFFKRNNEDG